MHFMWVYQRHFCIGQQCAAKRVFRTLDPQFRPLVFLVGVLANDRGDRYRACVEPEDNFWIESDMFDQIGDRLHEKRATYGESHMLQSHPVAQQRQDDHLTKRAIRDLILQIVEECPTRPDNYTFFASYPVLVDDYWVSTVLGLQSSVISSHYALTKETVPWHECRDIPVARSFIDAVIKQFLSSSEGELRETDAGAGLSQIDTDETLRRAAHLLMRDTVWRLDHDRIEGMSSLFGSCNTIASLPYEQQACVGTIILARSDHPAVQRQLTFQTPTDMTKTRAARKLLELASGELSLHSDSERLYGLATVNSYEAAEENLFTVRILEHHHWELAHANNPLMRVKYGQPYLPQPPFDAPRLCSDLRRVFQDITDTDIQRLTALVEQAEQERHGTILVISADAEAEAQRLRNQATPVEPCLLTPALLKHLTPIDGAVLLSSKGVCYAVGVILDGMATDDGDPGRGARYNSALRYVSSTNANCLSIVISEDRGIVFFPDMRLSIKRSTIDDVISQLRELLDKKKIPLRTFVKILDWLDEHRFYLLPEDCELLNSLVQVIDARLDAQEPREININRPPFTPDPTMDAQKYYEEE